MSTQRLNTTVTSKSSKRSGGGRQATTMTQSQKNVQSRQDLNNSQQQIAYSSQQFPQDSQVYSYQQPALAGEVERFVVNLNDQMQNFMAENEVRNQQNYQVMKMQAQRIVELQQMTEAMRNELSELKKGKYQIYDKTKRLNEGINQMQMLEDFELLSKNLPLNGNNSNNLFRDDALNNFINSYNQTGQIGNEGQLSQSQQFPDENAIQQQQQGSRLPSRNHFQSAASLALAGSSKQPFYQQNQGVPEEMQQQQQLPQKSYPKELNPVLERIQQQNEMLSKLVSGLNEKAQEKGKQNQPHKKNKKRKDSSDSSDSSSSSSSTSNAKSSDGFRSQEDAEERQFLKKKLKYLESQVRSKQLQNFKDFDRNDPNDPDNFYLSEAAKQYNQNKSNLPYYQQPPTYPNYQNFPRNNASFQQPQLPPPANNQLMPSPEEFLKQVQQNHQRFNQQPSSFSGQSNPFPFPPYAGSQLGTQDRPPFLNPKTTLPSPDTLAQIFKSQLMHPSAANPGR